MQDGPEDRNGDVMVHHPTGLGGLRQPPTREEPKAGPLFVIFSWAAMIAFSAVTWLLLITLLF